MNTTEDRSYRTNMRYFLPDKFDLAHNLCFMMHDNLAQIVTVGEEAGIFNVRVPLDSETKAKEFDNLLDDDIPKWLEENGYDAVTEELMYRQVCCALLGDFCHFVYEALACSQKGKITVAYSLLRKPFKNNLFYFEWMLVDPRGFIDAFLNKGPDALDIERGLEWHGGKHHLIKEAIERTQFPLKGGLKVRRVAL